MHRHGDERRGRHSTHDPPHSAGMPPWLGKRTPRRDRTTSYVERCTPRRVHARSGTRARWTSVARCGRAETGSVLIGGPLERASHAVPIARPRAARSPRSRGHVTAEFCRPPAAIRREVERDTSSGRCDLRAPSAWGYEAAAGGSVRLCERHGFDVDDAVAVPCCCGHVVARARDPLGAHTAGAVVAVVGRCCSASGGVWNEASSRNPPSSSRSTVAASRVGAQRSSLVARSVDISGAEAASVSQPGSTGTSRARQAAPTRGLVAAINGGPSRVAWPSTPGAARLNAPRTR
jgi:hypothetical protein